MEADGASHAETCRLATVMSPDGPCPVLVTGRDQWRIHDIAPHLVPRDCESGLLDGEIELAVVIGRTARHIDSTAAAEVITGYMIGIDPSARDWQFDPRTSATIDTFGGKAFDGSCPIGPWIVPSASIPDPQAMDLMLSVNGTVRQAGTTRSMIWSVSEQVALISEELTLEPGDVILTGTPSGAGIGSDTFLHPGDTIDAMIDGIGALSVTITP